MAPKTCPFKAKAQRRGIPASAFPPDPRPTETLGRWLDQAACVSRKARGMHMTADDSECMVGCLLAWVLRACPHPDVPVQILGTRAKGAPRCMCQLSSQAWCMPCIHALYVLGTGHGNLPLCCWLSRECRSASSMVCVQRVRSRLCKHHAWAFGRMPDIHRTLYWHLHSDRWHA